MFIPNKRVLLLIVLALWSVFSFASEQNCPELTKLQITAGYVSEYTSWMNFVKLLGIGAVVVGIGFIFSGLIETLVRLFYKYLLEFALWATSISLIIGANFINVDYQSWMVMIGSLLIPVAWIFTAKTRGMKENPPLFTFVMMIIWGAIALFYQSSGVGFFSVGALLVWLGFEVATGPFCYAFGFTDEDSVWRGTISGFIITAIYTASKVASLNLGPFNVFESGALWLASFTCFIGILITSTRWYWEEKKTGSYLGMNFIAIIILVGFISIGMLYNVKEITTMATTFLLFYLAAKPMEIPTESFIAFGVKLLFVGGGFFSVWVWLNSHQEIARQFLSV